MYKIEITRVLKPFMLDVRAWNICMYYMWVCVCVYEVVACGYNHSALNTFVLHTCHIEAFASLRLAIPHQAVRS